MATSGTVTIHSVGHTQVRGGGRITVAGRSDPGPPPAAALVWAADAPAATRLDATDQPAAAPGDAVTRWLPRDATGQPVAGAAPLQANGAPTTPVTWVACDDGRPAVSIPSGAFLMLDQAGTNLVDSTVFVAMRFGATPPLSLAIYQPPSLILQQDVANASWFAWLTHTERYRLYDGDATLHLQWDNNDNDNWLEYDLGACPGTFAGTPPLPSVLVVAFQLKSNGDAVLIDQTGTVTTRTALGIPVFVPTGGSSAPLSIGSGWFSENGTILDDGTRLYHEVRLYPGTALSVGDMLAVHGALRAKWVPALVSAPAATTWPPIRYLRLERWDGLDQSIAVYNLLAYGHGVFFSAVDGQCSPMFGSYAWTNANSEANTGNRAVTQAVADAFVEMDLGSMVVCDRLRVNTQGFSAGLRVRGLDAARGTVFSVDFQAGVPADLQVDYPDSITAHA